jgi:hypothetical protein
VRTLAVAVRLFYAECRPESDSFIPVQIEDETKHDPMTCCDGKDNDMDRRYNHGSYPRVEVARLVVRFGGELENSSCEDYLDDEYDLVTL